MMRRARGTPGGALAPYVLVMCETPTVAESAPDVAELTAYDIRHSITYLRLLDADNERADWEEAARIVLGLDPIQDEDGARRTWASHLARARWMSREGYRLLRTVDREFWEANRPGRLAS